MDGPFGTSTREIFESEHVVLIASGIGVTPYASILQSIASRYLKMKRSCPNCQHTWYDESAQSASTSMKLKLVYILFQLNEPDSIVQQLYGFFKMVSWYVMDINMLCKVLRWLTQM